MRRVKEEYLIDLSEKFLGKVINVNSCFDIIKQYNEYFTNYNEEMNVSSSFYSSMIDALTVSVIMELSNLYDTNKNSTNIEKLLRLSKANKEFFPKSRKMSGNKPEEDYYITHSRYVLDDEIEFFQNDGDQLFLRNVEMTIDKYFELFEWKYKRIEENIKCLMIWRNKFYAHNNVHKFNDVKNIIKEYPLTHKDIESLIAFPTEFCRFVLGMLTDVDRAIMPVNIDDWRHTLELVRIGLKYQEQEIRERYGADDYFDDKS